MCWAAAKIFDLCKWAAEWTQPGMADLLCSETAVRCVSYSSADV